MEKIDIVVTWLDSSDKEWQAEFLKYKNKELAEKSQISTNSQAFGFERYRDWGLFKFWWRCVANSCPWANKIFLVVKNQNHVPAWLNKKHPKLRIITHDEFIPKELLPTFNGLEIEMFISRIPDLSENFIISDDDYYFLNPIPDTTFFRNDIPVQNVQLLKGTRCPSPDNVWFNILYNSDQFVKKEISTSLAFSHSHLPEARKKSFELQILEKYWDDIIAAFNKSHFRHPDNIMEWLFCDIMKAKQISISENIYKNSIFININPKLTKENIGTLWNCDMVCFNDAECSNHEDIKLFQRLIYSFFLAKYPEKCEFEI